MNPLSSGEVDRHMSVANELLSLCLPWGLGLTTVGNGCGMCLIQQPPPMFSSFQTGNVQQRASAEGIRALRAMSALHIISPQLGPESGVCWGISFWKLAQSLLSGEGEGSAGFLMTSSHRPKNNSTVLFRCELYERFWLPASITALLMSTLCIPFTKHNYFKS